MPARRCSICSFDWPDDDQYNKCPSCEDKTSRFRNISPMDSDEARSLRLHFEFERFYEKYDAEADPARLLPGPDLDRFDAPAPA